MAKPKARQGNKAAAAQAAALGRRERDRVILLSAGLVLVLLFLLGLVAPALISMKSTVAAVGGFLLVALCLTGVALIVDRVLVRFLRG